MMPNRKILSLTLSMCFISSCATMINTEKQKVTIDSLPQNANIFVAEVKGKKETRTLVERRLVGVTPMTVSLKRKNSAVILEKEGYQPAEVPLKRSDSALILGNIITGGTTGTSIDMSSGASIEFDPSQYLVELQPLAAGQESPSPASVPAPMAAPEGGTPLPGAQ